MGKRKRLFDRNSRPQYLLFEEEMVRKMRRKVLEDIQVFLDKREMRRIENGEQLVITLQIRPNGVKPQGQASNAMPQ
jgi:hypothetical protein